MISDYEWTNISVVCEGQTEETFIKKVVNPYLKRKCIKLHPTLLNGNVSVERIVDDVVRARYNYVTTFVDYYGFKNSKNKSRQELIDEITLKAEGQKKHLKVIPYIQMYEMEALWFSDVDSIVSVMNADEKQHNELNQIIKEFHDNPESINNAYDTAPSKRLLKIFKGRYKKITDGKEIAEKIGIHTMLNKCQYFEKWLNEIENIAQKIP